LTCAGDALRSDAARWRIEGRNKEKHEDTTWGFPQMGVGL
jgi:hypothetical protein